MHFHVVLFFVVIFLQACACMSVYETHKNKSTSKISACIPLGQEVMTLHDSSCY